MMKRAIGLMVAIGVLSGGVAVAQSYTAIESFSNLTSASTTAGNNTSATPQPVDGDPTPDWPDASYDSSYEYDDLIQVVNDAGLVFPSPNIGGDTRAIRVVGTTDHFFRVIRGTDLPGTTPVAQFGLALKVESLAPRNAGNNQNSIDVIRVLDPAGTGGAANVFALVVREAGTESELRFRLTGAGDTVLSTTAFDPDSPDNWVGKWVVLAGIINRQTDGSGTAKVWAIDQASSDILASIDLTNLTNTNTNGIGALTFGATFDVPPATASSSTSILVDEITFFNEADETSFLQALDSTYGTAVTSVSDWSIY